MLAETTWGAIHRWVAARLDCPPKATRGAGIHAQAHGSSLADYHDVYVWLMGQAAIVSAPADLADAVRHAVAGQAFAALGDPAFWRGALGGRVKRTVGPSYQGFVDASTFRTGPTLGARPLTSADRPALSGFVAACPPHAWADSAIALDHDPIFALERDGALIALASAPLDGPVDVGMRSVGVVTLPAWRGQGAGGAVVGALTSHWLARGAPLRYQTLRANVASVAIARALGYVDVATTLAVRLR